MVAGLLEESQRDMEVTRGSNNIFEDVGFEREEAASLKVRADLILDLRKYIETRGWTQCQVAAFLDRKRSVSVSKVITQLSQ